MVCEVLGTDLLLTFCGAMGGWRRKRNTCAGNICVASKRNTPGTARLAANGVGREKKGEHWFPRCKIAYVVEVH